MYKNLSPSSLGVSGRQSELIELALTYKFRGFDLDMVPVCRQAEMRGLDHARRFIASAKIKIGGFELPVRWQGDESLYRQDLKRLEAIAKVAAEVGALGCHTSVVPASDERPYHENFEFHRQRINEIAEVLQPHGVRLGLGLRAAAPLRADRQFQFIASPDALLTFLQTLALPNVGIVVDTWNWHVGGGTLDQLRDLGASRVVGLRLADLPRDVPLDAVVEKQRLLPGESGVVPNVAIVSLLASMGYKGPVTPHAHASRFRGKTRDKIVQRAAESLRGIFQAAGLEEAPRPAPVAAAVGADGQEEELGGIEGS
jgi:sugar phosphate isomerase/epimerase